jgi:hypothetical protein
LLDNSLFTNDSGASSFRENNDGFIGGVENLRHFSAFGRLKKMQIKKL